MDAWAPWIVLPSLVLAGCASSGAESATSVTGAAGDLILGPSATAIAGTFWGADDGLNILITDARDPCGAWTEGRRQPNTTTLVLSFADATGVTGASEFVPTEAGAGNYTFAKQRGPGLAGARWLMVSRAYRLDGSCRRTGDPLIGLDRAPVGGAGTLDGVVRFPGGRADGSFSADFADGSLHGTFSAPFCNEPVSVTACDYFSPTDNEPVDCVRCE